MQKSIKLLFLLLFLSACTSSKAISQTPTLPTVLQPIAAENNDTPTPTVGSLIKILYASDPSLPQYDPNSKAYAQFPDTIKQLSDMGAGAIDASSHMATAIRFPRQDSYLAAQALLTLGVDITETTIPILIDNLHSEKPEARIYSVILLGSVGNRASCAVGDIAPLLWDSDPFVRSATAIALKKITERDLVASDYNISITPSFLAGSISADTPEGKVAESARRWWNEQGSKVNWHPNYGICDP